jgi:hypothetical protein
MGRIAVILLAVISICVATIWIVSYFCAPQFTYSMPANHGGYLIFTDGELWARDVPFGSIVDFQYWQFNVISDRDRKSEVEPSYRVYLGFFRDIPARGLIRIPLWIPFMLAALWPARTVAWRLLRPMRRRRQGLCVRCGYNIWGLDTPRCPECGTGFDLTRTDRVAEPGT